MFKTTKTPRTLLLCHIDFLVASLLGIFTSIHLFPVVPNTVYWDHSIFLILFHLTSRTVSIVKSIGRTPFLTASQ